MNRQILRLAIPNIISNVTVPLLGLVDLAVLGHLESEVYIGAIALGGVLFNFLYWGFGFLRMGTSGFTAQAFGQHNLSEAVHTLVRALLVAGLGGFFIILVKSPIGWIAFNLLEGNRDVTFLAKQYYSIRVFAAPATLGLYALTGWFIGMQNAKAPMIIAIVANLVNVGMDFFFVFVLGMKSDGVALGTVIAQYTGLIIALVILFRYYRRLFKYFIRQIAFKATAFGSFFSVNANILIRTLFLIFVFSFFTSKSAAQNDRMLAVNTLLLQFLMVFSYFTDGFAYAAEALTGKYIGSKNPARLHQTIRLLFRWGLGITIPFTMAYAIMGTSILNILTNNQEVIDSCRPYFFWVLLLPLAGFPSYLWDGIYIGATAGRGLRNTMLLSTMVVFLPVWFLTRSSMGNHGLWLALTLFLVARGLSQWIAARRAVYAKANR
ncbi:MAG: MATE family efflux transporter [Bacteroidales bacterium]|nr:MATE family efflux transporter [Bacteroidales bacterium]